MGFLDKAKAIANEAKDAGKRVVDVVGEHIQETSSRDDNVGKIVQRTQELSQRGIEVAQDKAEQISQHSSGQKAGRAVRKVGSVINNLPLLSAAADSIRAKNCIDLLIENLRNHPDNAYANLWLAEGLIKTSQDLKKYRYVKGVIDPSSFLIAGALQTTAEFGTSQRKTDEKLLIRAWSLAISELKDNPRSSSALDVLSRVYLAKGDLKRSMSTAKCAILANSKDPLPRITFSRALLASGRLADAQKIALGATHLGSSVGFLIAAEAEQLEARDGNKIELTERVRRYEELVQRVTIEDRKKYNGAFREAREIASATKDLQVDKTNKALSTAKRWGGIVRDA